MEILVIVIVGIVSFTSGLYLSKKLNGLIEKKKDITKPFRTVEKRRKYQKKSYKKTRATHNGISDEFNKEENTKKRTPRKNSGKRKYYKGKNNNNRRKKVVKT